MTVKAYAYIDGGSSMVQRQNFNLTITRSSTGTYFGTFTGNAMDSSYYSVLVIGQVSASFPRTINVTASSKSTTRTGNIFFNENGSTTDPVNASFVVIGD